MQYKPSYQELLKAAYIQCGEKTENFGTGPEFSFLLFMKSYS